MKIMTSDLDQIIEKLKKLESKSQNIDEVYGHRVLPENEPSKVAALNHVAGTTAAEDPEIVTAIKEYIKLAIKDQKQDLLMFNQMIFSAIRNPSEGDALVERFGGNTTPRDIYTEGAFEIRAILTQYKQMLKDLKKL